MREEEGGKPCGKRQSPISSTYLRFASFTSKEDASPISARPSVNECTTASYIALRRQRATHTWNSHSNHATLGTLSSPKGNRSQMQQLLAACQWTACSPYLEECRSVLQAVVHADGGIAVDRVCTSVEQLSHHVCEAMRLSFYLTCVYGVARDRCDVALPHLEYLKQVPLVGFAEESKKATRALMQAVISFIFHWHVVPVLEELEQLPFSVARLPSQAVKPEISGLDSFSSASRRPPPTSPQEAHKGKDGSATAVRYTLSPETVARVDGIVSAMEPEECHSAASLSAPCEETLSTRRAALHAEAKWMIVNRLTSVTRCTVWRDFLDAFFTDALCYHLESDVLLRYSLVLRVKATEHYSGVTWTSAPASPGTEAMDPEAVDLRLVDEAVREMAMYHYFVEERLVRQQRVTVAQRVVHCLRIFCLQYAKGNPIPQMPVADDNFMLTRHLRRILNDADAEMEDPLDRTTEGYCVSMAQRTQCRCIDALAGLDLFTTSKGEAKKKEDGKWCVPCPHVECSHIVAVEEEEKAFEECVTHLSHNFRDLMDTLHNNANQLLCDVLLTCCERVVSRQTTGDTTVATNPANYEATLTSDGMGRALLTEAATKAYGVNNEEHKLPKDRRSLNLLRKAHGSCRCAIM